MNTERVQLEALSISQSEVHPQLYVLLLAEVGGNRRVPVVVSSKDAMEIALRMDNVVVPRPMTHDLMLNIATSFDVRVEEVVINHFECGIFFSTIKLNNGTYVKEVESRTSDAVSLALRANAPIYISAHLLEKVAIDQSLIGNVCAEDCKKEDSHVVELEHMNDHQLDICLAKALANENYEEAAVIQQLLTKRKEQK